MRMAREGCVEEGSVEAGGGGGVVGVAVVAGRGTVMGLIRFRPVFGDRSPPVGREVVALVEAGSIPVGHPVFVVRPWGNRSRVVARALPARARRGGVALAIRLASPAGSIPVGHPTQRRVRPAVRIPAFQVGKAGSTPAHAARP